MKANTLFVKRWMDDILSITEKPNQGYPKVLSRTRSASKKQLSEFEFLPSILQSLVEAGTKGDLCIEANREIETELKNLPQNCLIYDNNLLYFQKTWQAKKDLEDGFRRLIEYTKTYREKYSKRYIDEKINESINGIEKRWNEKHNNGKKVELGVSIPKSFALNDEQKQAIREAVRSPFHIITGGPGTGKTTVVAFLMEVLNELTDNIGQKELPQIEDIALAAPTGRAGQRLTESIQSSWGNMDSRIAGFPDIKGTTIHRLLRYQIHNQKFYFNKDRSFLHRLVLVDEVSMVDIFLFQSLLSAIPDLTTDVDELPFRFLLLGDPNQLPSVEKGAVFRDILLEIDNKCKDDPALRSLLLTELKESNRHSSLEGKEILKLANSLLPGVLSNTGDEQSSILSKFWKDLEKAFTEQDLYLTKIQKDYRIRDEACRYLWDKVFLPQIKSIIESNIGNPTVGILPDELTFSKWTTQNKCLTLYRRGFFGIEGLQSLIDKKVRSYLNGKSIQEFPRVLLNKRLYYPGLPIIITKNDSIRKLFNGDIGFVLLDGKELRACFLIDGQIRVFALDTLPEHEEAYFLTVHKSQGSEYENLFIYIPPVRGKGKANANEKSDNGNPALGDPSLMDTNTHSFGDEDSDENGLANKQILYTGITRAKKTLEIFGSKEGWEEASRTTQERLTGFKL